MLEDLFVWVEGYHSCARAAMLAIDAMRSVVFDTLDPHLSEGVIESALGGIEHAMMAIFTVTFVLIPVLARKLIFSMIPLSLRRIWTSGH